MVLCSHTAELHKIKIEEDNRQTHTHIHTHIYIYTHIYTQTTSITISSGKDVLVISDTGSVFSAANHCLHVLQIFETV
jgi:hypothetical protein